MNIHEEITKRDAEVILAKFGLDVSHFTERAKILLSTANNRIKILSPSRAKAA